MTLIPTSQVTASPKLNPKIYALGENALVIDCSALFPALSKLAIQSRILDLAKQCHQQHEFLDLVPGMNNLTLFLRDSSQVHFWIAELTRRWHNTIETSISGPILDIPVVYGGQYGPDLDKLATLHQLSSSEIICLHTKPLYTVLFIGFQPGFPYLDGLDSRLATPRLSTPRISIPAGSVGIGDNQTGIYPADAPGGWQLIGRTNISLFTPIDAHSPTLLVPGDRVRFVPVANLEFAADE